MLSYVEAILRTYNEFGRRDNIYKARIKILVHELGAEAFAKEVEAEWQSIKDGALALDPAAFAEIGRALSSIRLMKRLDDNPPALARSAPRRSRFRCLDGQFSRQSQSPGLRHRHAVAQAGRPARRATPPPSRWMRLPILPTATRSAKSASATSRISCCRMWRSATCRRCGARSTQIGVATPNVGLVSDIISCPGLDYCSLANARSIPIAQEITRRFRNLDLARDLGRLHINISGCINACGHHHVGHIGILGVEKNGEEFYQITLGGKADEHAKLGALIGPAVPYAQVADVVEDIAAAYVELRERPDELFIDTVKRTGVEPFRERVYATR